MPFEKGHKLGGRPARQMWTDALRVAVLEATDEGDRTRLRAIAERVVKEAMKGKTNWLQAAQEIGNRLDGKPAQAMTLDHFGIDGIPLEDKAELLSTLEALREIAFQAGLLKYMTAKAQEDAVH